MTALVCIYNGRFGQTPSHFRALARQVILAPAPAAALAAAASKVSVARPPDGAVNCPADFGRTTVITFSYHHRTPVSLWWNTTGCQTLDNGHLQATQLGHPSFDAFRATFTHATHPARQ